MTERDGGSKKALLLALVVVAIAGGGAWFTFVRKSPSPATLLAAPVARAESKPAEASRLAEPPASVVAQASGSALNAGSETPPGSRVSPIDSVAHKQVAARKSPATRESSPTTLDVDLSAPTIPGSVDVDAVTRGIEQSTKAKIDSAQKPRIDIKPIFKKP